MMDLFAAKDKVDGIILLRGLRTRSIPGLPARRWASKGRCCRHEGWPASYGGGFWPWAAAEDPPSLPGWLQPRPGWSAEAPEQRSNFSKKESSSLGVSVLGRGIPGRTKLRWDRYYPLPVTRQRAAVRPDRVPLFAMRKKGQTLQI